MNAIQRSLDGLSWLSYLSLYGHDLRATGKFHQIFLASSLNSSSPWCRDAFILME